jgi:hypothetical protein
LKDRLKIESELYGVIRRRELAWKVRIQAGTLPKMQEHRLFRQIFAQNAHLLLTHSHSKLIMDAPH